MDGAAVDRAPVKISLYQRLGGAAGVAAAIDDAFDRHAANPTLARRFHGQDLPELKAQSVSFLSAASGGPEHGTRDGPATQHAGMGFNAAELQAVVLDLAEALAEQGVGVAEVGEVVSLIRMQNHHPPAA